MIDLNHSRNLAVRPCAGCFQVLFPLPILIAGLGLMLAGQVTAQTFTTLHSFTAAYDPQSGPSTNSDGAYPNARLILSGNTLYGEASQGGSSGIGTVFRVNTDGTGFSTLFSVDGIGPVGGLLLSGNTLYGTAAGGPNSGLGTVFAVNTDGTDFTSIYRFTGGSDGGGPVGGLILSGHTLYGTASGGGSSGNGTVFAIKTDGTGLTNLHIFAATPFNPPYTNSDGAIPSGGLILSNDTLYGTTELGGSSGWGTVFKVNTDGTGFTNLHYFTSGLPDAYGWYTNCDGRHPLAGLILSGNTLYGTATEGGNSGFGTVFKVNTDGTGFATPHSFTNLPIPANHGFPRGGLILWGNSLYGTTSDFVDTFTTGFGMVFALNTDGTGFTNLHSFAAGAVGSIGFYTNRDGTHPYAGLILSGNTLYGTALGGGSSGFGTVFSLSFTPQLTINPSAENLILTWPTSYAGFDYSGYALQSTTNLGSSAIWTTNSPAPIVVNGQNTVTNPIASTQQFYRLRQQ